MSAAPVSAREQRAFYLLQFFRSVMAVGLCLFTGRTIDLGTDLSLVILSAVIGVFMGGGVARRYRSPLRVGVQHGCALIVLFVGFSIAEWALVGDAKRATNDFYIYQLRADTTVLLLAYFIGLGSTWLFWRVPAMVTVEAVLFSAVFMWLLSGHRNYHLDAPKNISALAWDLSVAPQHLILAFGVLSTLFLAVYLTLAHSRPVFTRDPVILEYGRTRWVLTLAVPSALLLLLVGLAAWINKGYSENLTRATNGVGQTAKEGQSPLGFHSAVGKTRQPAALIRLEGDYGENPWAPMLYLREGALSAFNGRELVLADRAYDRDVPRIAPGQSFTLGRDAEELTGGEGVTRRSVTQSVFLLAKHNTPFAIDFPISFRPLKNPDPERFELSYQVVSLAPVVKSEALIGEEVGDPAWDEATWAHYLRAPGSTVGRNVGKSVLESETPVLDENGEDLRYKALAEKLAGDDQPPIQKVLSVITYLSTESIYTRSPGHQPTERGDPVAPYLFSKEKRGYCVHFAHSAVYLLRLLGIPARIATGYLTDLSYAKDGHILVHLGDRHAWPEVFVRGQGWVVFDISPERAENEQVIVPDEKLLQELMSKIAPAEVLLDPPAVAEEGRESTDTVLGKVIESEILVPLLLVIVVALFTLKLWLRFGYLVLPPGRRKVRLAYVAFASSMADLGLPRGYGETRWEYAERLARDYGVDARSIIAVTEKNTFSPAPPPRSTGELFQTLEQTFASLRSSKIRFRRWVGPLSPLSIFQLRKW